MNRKEKKWNRDLSSLRSTVENVHSRMKDFAIIGTKYRGKKYDEEERQFLSMVVRVITSLVNFKLDRAPLRRHLVHKAGSYGKC